MNADDNKNAKSAFERSADVVVVGGGVAGAAAAIQCARSGLDVVLLEKTILPGGLATSGLVNVFLPLCDGEGNQVLDGIAEEFFNAAVELGPGAVPPNWRKKQQTTSKRQGICRFATEFSPAAFALALERMLGEAGVDIWYDTVATGTIVRDGAVRGVKAFNKSGNGTLTAKIVVDATGDGDVAKDSGCDMVEGKSSLSAWFLDASMETARQAVSLNAPEMPSNIISLGETEKGLMREKTSSAWRGIDGKTVSEAVRTARRLILEYYSHQERDENNDPIDFPLALPTLPQLRTTRRIDGRATMDNSKNRHDRVAFIPDWKRRGVIWELPLGALIPKPLDGLLVAGRCVSAQNGDTWDAARSIPTAATSGQIAGIVASLAMDNNTVKLSDISPKSVREKLSQSVNR